MMLPALTLLTSFLGSNAPGVASSASGIASAAQAAGFGPGATPTPATPAQDFGSILSDVAHSTADKLKKAEVTASAGIQGHASVQQVTEAVTSAQESLQMALAVRDKVVSAYQEISRMTM